MSRKCHYQSSKLKMISKLINNVEPSTFIIRFPFFFQSLAYFKMFLGHVIWSGILFEWRKSFCPITVKTQGGHGHWYPKIYKHNLLFVGLKTGTLLQSWLFWTKLQRLISSPNNFTHEYHSYHSFIFNCLIP